MQMWYLMAEKMTAVWLIILTVLVCSAVPAMMIWLTSMPHSNAKMLIGIQYIPGSIFNLLTNV